MAFDFKKAYKEFYMPKNRPEIVTVPKANYIAVRGSGNPNDEGGVYQQAVGILYSVAYTLKLSYKSDYKIEGFFEYVVPPLQERLGVLGAAWPSTKCSTTGHACDPPEALTQSGIVTRH